MAGSLITFGARGEGFFIIESESRSTGAGKETKGFGWPVFNVPSIIYLVKLIDFWAGVFLIAISRDSS